MELVFRKEILRKIRLRLILVMLSKHKGMRIEGMGSELYRLIGVNPQSILLSAWASPSAVYLMPLFAVINLIEDYNWGAA